MCPKPNDNFFEQVYAIARMVPFGRVTTYGAIAKALGTASSSRMVGWALSSSHTQDVPAHRVVNRNGMLTGKIHFATPTQMQEMLEAESIKVLDDKVQDFEMLFWDPRELADSITF
ncbi:MAG: MGMT family protein [Prevotellaceae bacterium]|jgi:methylated-DNA-protein-cysteine methyltransferase-like protein|nr:MGMT family protein [Prevotellaceae bacterium]